MLVLPVAIIERVCPISAELVPGSTTVGGAISVTPSEKV
jgi:hypothetical protein